MDGINIDIEKVIEDLTEDLKNYTEQVEQEVAEAVDKCTLETEREIRKNSPVGKTGDFKDGWDRFNYRKKSGRAGVVKNYPKGSIVHLLEFGHKARNYDKNHIMVAPSPLKGNVKPANERAMERLDREIQHILSFTK